MLLELHAGTIALGVLLIAPLLAVGNLVVWWQTRERAMLWWAAGSLTAATAAPQVQPETVALGYVSIALALCFYWEGIRSFQRRSVPGPLCSLARPGAAVLLGAVLVGAASDYRELVLATAIGGVSAVCAYELLLGYGKFARESSYFVGGLFTANALFFFVFGLLVAAVHGAAGLPREMLHVVAYAELLVLLIGWNFGFVMMAMQRYLELATEFASHDELTGALNRRALVDKVRHHINLAERGGSTLSILAMDLDHFKRINDTYGHRAGDDVLRAFASTTQSCLRATDQFGRVGGEEFVVLLPATSATGALAMAERLRQALAGSTVPCRGESITVTVSIGVAEFDRHTQDFESLLESADTALYAAKHRGRNCVELAPHLPSVSPIVQLTWDGRYTSGNRVIDTEHEHLFQLVNQLVRNAQEHSDVRMLHRHLEEMLVWLSEHFRHEEAIFIPTGWAGADLHIEQHQQLENRGRNLLAGIANGDHAHGELLDFLIREVVGNHLAKEDTNYFSAVANRHLPPEALGRPSATPSDRTRTTS